MSAARRGAIFGLLAAASFGVSAPLAKLLLAQTAPLALAALLYAGAALALAVLPGAAARAGRPRAAEAPLRARDLPALGAIVVLGGVVGPALMLLGLGRLSAVAGALLLNLEGPLTALVAVLAFREHMGRRAALATLLVTGGAALLGASGGGAGAGG